MSARFKHSFKTALAIVLAYGLALWFDWDSPKWAAFAAILISLPTLEASIGKGGQRLGGTLLAAVVALPLVGLFAQERWWFMLFQAGWLAFCAYRMTASNKSYFWFCAGFVSAIISANGGPDAVNIFAITVTRTLETCLGIACFTVVFSLLWPARAVADAPAPAAAAPGPPPGVDRLNRAVRVFIAWCTGFLLVIYVPDFPGGYGFLAMLAPFSIMVLNSAQISPEKLVVPVALSMLFASPIYLFVMPLLEGYTQLGLVIFLACFSISYTLHKPEQGLACTIGLAFFAVVAGIANEQSYSFLSVANTALMFFTMLLLLYVCSGIQVFRVRENIAVGAGAGNA